MNTDLTYNRLAAQLLRNLNSIGDEDTEGNAVVKQIDLILKTFEEVVMQHDNQHQHPNPNPSAGDEELGEIG